MDITNYLPLAPRDLMVLAVIAEGPIHGYGLIKAVEARSNAGVLLDPANLYRVLRRMKDQGWIRKAAEGGDGQRAAKFPAAGATDNDNGQVMIRPGDGVD